MRRLAIWALSMAVVAAAPAPSRASAQSVSAADLKAAFVANFAKFTEWPPRADGGQQLLFCVIGDAPVESALKSAVTDPAAAVVNLSALAPNEALRGCRVLYVGHLDQTRLTELLAAVQDAPVFTVSDVDHFAERGGVAQLIVQNNRMRFAINPAAAQRAHLQLSARLMTLAIIVKDEGNAQR